MSFNEMLSAYWSRPELETNGLILLNLIGALLLGLMVGYERAYHGRAAGMRTYGLVCMASAALTIIGGYPDFWFGGHGGAFAPVTDPTRIIQGVVTGIGFLGAGVIMREGFIISGLTTAAKREDALERRFGLSNPCFNGFNAPPYFARGCIKGDGVACICRCAHKRDAFGQRALQQRALCTIERIRHKPGDAILCLGANGGRQWAAANRNAFIRVIASFGGKA
jgi:hypothetical protein